MNFTAFSGFFTHENIENREFFKNEQLCTDFCNVKSSQKCRLV